jgi:cellulose synthase/poly-beta-1,6-N-acetylglucosamine synthase-like glycosyltransferase
MNTTASTIFTIAQLSLFILLAIPMLYMAFFAFAGLFYRRKSDEQIHNPYRIALFIPAYREDAVILDTVQNALQQDYPSELFTVVVIADSLSARTLSQLRQLPVTVVEVRFEKSTKVKALNAAFNAMSGSFDLVVILDADNHMAQGFLRKIDASFGNSTLAVQGHRTAKNLHTPLAVLDAISEEINNHLFRKGHVATGLSAAIIGSGMAFRYGYFRELLSESKAVGGFDKEVELEMLKNGFHIGYRDDAVVYDEKTSNGRDFTNQRRRWLSAQITYFRKDAANAVSLLLRRGNIDYFDKVVQFIQPPRILLLGTILLFSGVFIAADLLIGHPALWMLWMILAAVCIASFMISIPARFYSRNTMAALRMLPAGMILMMKSLLKIRGANRQFLHTPHTSLHVTTQKSR